MEIKTIKEFLNKKERELSNLMETSRSKIEKAQDIGYEEIQKLQAVIEEQSELIRSYEQEINEDKKKSKWRAEEAVENKRIISDLTRVEKQEKKLLI